MPKIMLAQSVKAYVGVGIVTRVKMSWIMNIALVLWRGKQQCPKINIFVRPNFPLQFGINTRVKT